jgi:hypothetical protein
MKAMETRLRARRAPFGLPAEGTSGQGNHSCADHSELVLYGHRGGDGLGTEPGPAEPAACGAISGHNPRAPGDISLRSGKGIE